MGSVDPFSVPRPTRERERFAASLPHWLCVVDTGRGTRGTGLLVGADLVLTSYHVVESFAPADAAELELAFCLFDFYEGADGVPTKGRRVGFAAEWGVAGSLYSEGDKAGARSGFQYDKVDYAVIQLAERIGDEPGGDAGSGGEAEPRGWLPIPARTELPEPEASIFIYHHPVAIPTPFRPGKVSMPQTDSAGKVLEYLGAAEVLDIARDGLRLRHNVTTHFGSSGAPCFDIKDQLVALHHAGDRIDAFTGNGEWNQAVPITAVVRHLRASGNGHLVGVAPQPWQPPAPPDRALGALTAQALEDKIERRLWAASVLMDRDDTEDCIDKFRRDAGNRGIVHALACRQVDKHRNFVDRLSLVPVGDGERDAREKRRRAFLGENAGEAVWALPTLHWYPDQDEPVAFGLIRKQLSDIAAAPGRNLAVATVPLDEISVARERRIVPEVAAFCRTLARDAEDEIAERLQVLLVYFDLDARPGSNASATQRQRIGKLWDKGDRPPGCGACLEMEDVASFELDPWSSSLQSAWKLVEGRLGSLLEGVFGDKTRLPILNVEKSLRSDLQRLIASRL